VNKIAYQKAIDLLHRVSSPNGFLASAENTTNYNRVWARDGVICGLAALASGDEKLIATFKNTLKTLADHQHVMGTIPSNVLVKETSTEVSYGGLAGRVDAVTWYIIGVCQYAYSQDEPSFIIEHNTAIEKGFELLEAWEFNNKHLLYVPLSGNWADEYITDGYVLYDQLLRIWALKSYNYFAKSDIIAQKIENCTQQVLLNFMPNTEGEKFHPRAYEMVDFKPYMPCSFSPAGYKTQLDAFANSLVLLLKIGNIDFQKKLSDYLFSLASEMPLGLIPAFWPPVFETDEHWNLLKNNCKYEFRNHPYEFHNGGSWSMVNGFFGLSLSQRKENTKAETILTKINEANAFDDYSFYENFNTATKEPNGVTYCAWSAAASVLVHQTLQTNFKLLL
jgi:GH15 family glucan-1,4-alpha-glucosidase